MNTKIFAGLEEIFARLLAALIATVIFVVVVVARTEVSLEWLETAGWLLLFWFIYELLSIILFNIFTFFAGREPSPETLSTKDIKDEEVNDEENESYV